MRVFVLWAFIRKMRAVRKILVLNNRSEKSAFVLFGMMDFIECIFYISTESKFSIVCFNMSASRLYFNLYPNLH